MAVALSDRPLDRLRRLLARAPRTTSTESTAAVLATSTRSGRPSVRTVLVKTVDERGCVFFTSRYSRKAKTLAQNPRAALCFFWEPLGMQVTVEGEIEPVATEDIDAYWRTRPRRSQLGAWASRQSSTLISRQVLLDRLAGIARRFAGRPVPRPPFWAGFRVVPERVEFWTRRPFRLHDRQLYERRQGRWVMRRLYP